MRVGEDPVYLSSQRLKVRCLQRWSFGVQRYRRPIGELQAALNDLEASCEWRPSGTPSLTGQLVSLPHAFVPPDGSSPVPLNRALKNNFWNGSHVLEWGDLTKDCAL
jgi:hypothetical protein